MDPNDRLFSEACRLIPGGVNSPVRAFRAVGGTPRFIERAAGCRLYDVTGRDYIDYVGSWGPMILGHAHPQVIAAVTAAAHHGTSYGLPSRPEVELAGLICERMPAIEKVRMVNSGTEAVMGALRLARAATRRDKIIKFAGCYHGHADALLVRAGSGAATFGLPDSPGVPAGATRDTLIACYNNLASVDRLLNEHGDAVAAIIVEPVAGNMGVTPPEDGFLAGLRDRARSAGALLIFDEVMTGFRVAPGGAQELYRISPDLTTLGKIIGGGLPVGAYGGRADLMDRVAPAGDVYQAGTLSGNPLAMAAGIATLRLLDERVYIELERQADRLAHGLKQACAQARVPATVQRVGSMLTLFFTDKPVRCFDDAQSADHGRFAAFFQAMIGRGVHLPPSGYEAWFISAAHDDDAIDATLSASRDALAAIARSKQP